MESKINWPLLSLILLLLGGGAVSQIKPVHDWLTGGMDKAAESSANADGAAGSGDAGIPDSLTAKVETPKPAQSEPAQSEPAKSEPATPEPIKTEPAQSEPAKREPAQTEPVKQEAELAKPAEPQPTAEAAENAGAPLFQLLKVEPDGSTVIAGRAEPGNTIELHDGDKAIASEKSVAPGDFAIVLSQPLLPGEHELTLHMKRTDGSVLVSPQTGVVSIPDPAKGGELVATLFENGKVAQVLQKLTIPATQPAKAPEPQPKTEPETAPAAITGEVYVEAVEVESDKVIVAGKGDPAANVTIFVDNQELGKSIIGKEGSFVVEAPMKLAEGLHDIRADMLDETGKLVGRGSIIMQHGKVKMATDQDNAASQPASSGAQDVATPTAKPETGTGADASMAAGTAADTAAAGASATVDTATNGQAAGEAATQPVKVIESGASVIIRRGDNLWDISRRQYGKGIRYKVIFDANRTGIKNPDLIFPGQVIALPEKSK